MSRVSIPDIPLTIDPELSGILEPMKQMIEQLARVVDPTKIPTTKPAVTGVLWSDNGRLKLS